VPKPRNREANEAMNSSLNRFLFLSPVSFVVVSSYLQPPNRNVRKLRNSKRRLPEATRNQEDLGGGVRTRRTK
jgi:hypothetical protein